MSVFQVCDFTMTLLVYSSQAIIHFFVTIVLLTTVVRGFKKRQNSVNFSNENL